MTLELWMLLAAVAWGLVHIGAASLAFKQQAGHQYTVGPRDEDRRRLGVAGRLHRAQSNFQETFPLFAACVLLVALTDAGGSWSAWGAQLYLAGRIVYLPLYAAGIPWLRSIAWCVATLGIVLVGLEIAW